MIDLFACLRYYPVAPDVWDWEFLGTGGTEEEAFALAPNLDDLPEGEFLVVEPVEVE